MLDEASPSLDEGWINIHHSSQLDGNAEVDEADGVLWKESVWDLVVAKAEPLTSSLSWQHCTLPLQVPPPTENVCQHTVKRENDRSTHEYRSTAKASRKIREPGHCPRNHSKLRQESSY